MEKVIHHGSIDTLGFVTTMEPIKNKEIEKKISDYKETHGITVQILTFDEWIDYIYQRVSTPELSNESDLSAAWLIAYTESLAQQRRDIAPIDEPCIEWVLELKAKFEALL